LTLASRAPAAPRRLRWVITVTLALVASRSVAAAPAASPPTEPSAQSASYDLGLMLGNQLVHSGLGKTISRRVLMRGIDDALAGKTMTAEQSAAAEQFARDARIALASRNTRLAQEFLAHNAHAPGVQTTPTGLQYRVLAAGDITAPTPGPGDRVTLRYRLSLADRKVFDRSEDHPQQPATFRVDRVIPAWHEALLKMRPGAKWELFVPPPLGYGANSPPSIPPGALLVFELDLLTVDSTVRTLPRP
jgi:FKBP-type peptidyl-prolyl cis-trans isomerase FklB